MGFLKDKKKIIICAVAVIVIAIITGVIIFFKDDMNYLNMDEKTIFTKLHHRFDDYEENDFYEIKSIDAYYYDDGNLASYKYFYRVKYNSYLDIVKRYSEKDMVFYGWQGKIAGEFDLNWTEEELEDEQDVIDAFNIAVEKGEHKSYTEEEIKECLEKYKVEE